MFASQYLAKQSAGDQQGGSLRRCFVVLIFDNDKLMLIYFEARFARISAKSRACALIKVQIKASLKNPKMLCDFI